MERQCIICGKQMENKNKHDKCKECRKNHTKEWWKKNWKWVAGAGAVISFVVLDTILKSSNNVKDGIEDESAVENAGAEEKVHAPGEKYWNANTGNWEKDGKPYTYRVQYKDARDGEIHTHDYADVDNGYEDYEYYKKQWYSSSIQWDHVPPKDN